MTSWTIQRHDRGWRLPLQQRSVSRCTVDHAFALELHEDEQTAVLRIEGDFTIRDNDRTYQLSAAVPRELGPAVALFGQVIRMATISAEGALELTFEDGRTLSVEPDASYEAWGIVGPNGVRAVCAPGGAISIWQPKGPCPA
jgi:hypothetical protein